MCSVWNTVRPVQALGDHRHDQLAGDEHQPDQQPRRARREEGEHPQHLHQQHPDGVDRRPLAMLGHRGADAQPLGDDGDADQHVADDDHPEVAFLHARRHAGGEHEGAGDLHERQQPVDEVVGVVRRAEPREVHPRPPHRGEHHAVADQRVGVALFDEQGLQRVRGLSDGDHDREVEQQLERRRRAVRLVGVAARPPPANDSVASHPPPSANGTARRNPSPGAPVRLTSR